MPVEEAKEVAKAVDKGADTLTGGLWSKGKWLGEKTLKVTTSRVTLMTAAGLAFGGAVVDTQALSDALEGVKNSISQNGFSLSTLFALGAAPFAGVPGLWEVGKVAGAAAFEAMPTAAVG